MSQGLMQGHHTTVFSPGQSSLLSGQSSMSGQRHSGVAWSQGSRTQPVASSEGSPVVSQSRSNASSVVVCSDDGGSCIDTNTSSGSTNNSGSVLKEHDYIGLSEVSSSSVIKQSPDCNKARSESLNLNLEETDLRLGLGPASHSIGTAEAQATCHASKVASHGVGSGLHGFSGYNGSLALVSNGHAGSDVSVLTGNRPWASEQLKQCELAEKAAYSGLELLPKESSACVPAPSSQDDSRRDLSWFEKSQNVNQNLGLGIKSHKDPPNPQRAKSEGQRDMLLPSQCPPQLAAWPGQDVRYPPVDNILDRRSALPTEIPAPQNPLQSLFARNSDGSRNAAGRDVAGFHVSLPGQEFDGARSGVVNAFSMPKVMVPALKNGVKRGYSEAMVDAWFTSSDLRSGMLDGSTGASGAPVASIGGKNGLHLSEAELKQLSQYGKHQTFASLYNWSSMKASSLSPWQAGSEQIGGPFSSFASMPNKPTGLMTTHTDLPAGTAVGTWDARTKTQEGIVSVENQESQQGMVENQQSASTEPPPTKGQVVGWPPIRSFRKITLAGHPKHSGAGEDGPDGPVAASVNVQSSSSSQYVKVNMDGVPIGRKVDLNIHSSYAGLSLALEEMFQRSTNGQGGSQVMPGRESFSDSKQLWLLNGSDYVLTYEDKEGDWMLVGDVPWGMFVNTVRRLRIMKGSEATGLAPRGSEKSKCHK